MEAFVPGPKHQGLLGEKANEFARQIRDDWRGTSLAKNRRCSPSSKCKPIEGAQVRAVRDVEPPIQLHIVDGSNGDKRHSFNIEPSANLKTLFNEYAEKRGVSLRSLRFSYQSKMLFLSSIGNKSPKELNIRDQDIIVAHDTSANNETSTSLSCEPNKKVKKSKNRPPKRAKGKSKSKKKQVPARQEPVTSLEEYKAQHSKRLSKLHEEVDSRLKEIRTRLNCLGLQRQPPKRRRSKDKKTPRENSDTSGLLTPGVEGKAGRSHFLVQVGEVQHLYRTAKPSAGRSPCSPCGASSTLDLHGHTKEEALIKLDEHLKVWVDTAMWGSYPFVISAKIVCGCGNQTIAETVEKWIKSTRNVGNAPGQIH